VDSAGVVEQVRAQLQQANIYVVDEEPMQHGTRLHCHNDALVLVYTSGKIVVQGKNQDATKVALASHVAPSAERPPAVPAKASALLGDVQAALAAAWHRCHDCGALMPRPWKYCVACGAESFYERESSQCGECGHQIDAAWLHCPHCGSARG
jgi:RNA polymerase subunit RPABC4/transcription elongation factor Spt4